MNIVSGKKVSFVLVPNIAHPRGMFVYLSQVIQTLKQQIRTADVIIARTSLIGFMAASLANQMEKTWATEVVGCAWDAIWNYGNLTGRITAPFYYLWQKRMVNKAPFALYVTQEFLQKRYPCRGITAAVSDVNIPAIDNLSIVRRLKRVRQPGKPFVFGLIGSLQSKWKGIQTALSALGHMHTRMPNFELRILGDGDQTYWKKLSILHGIERSVRFMGTLPSGRAVLEWLDEVDVYLQPSLQEGLPRSLVEAMSRGCPAIASTAGGIPELLDSMVLHKPGDTNQLSELLMKSMNTEWRLIQATRNIENAKHYVDNVLEDKRVKFWKMFSEYAKQNR